MKDTDQIAAEAARKILGDIRNPDNLDIAIIKSAVEKAHQEGWYEGRDYERKFGAAHASEQRADV